MKKIITSAIAILAFTYSFAQEKGDRYLGLNLGIFKTDSKLNQNQNQNEFQFIGLTTRNFIKTNRIINLSIGLNRATNESNENNNTSLIKTSESKGYNINLGYGMLFPLLKNFYAEATPNLEYWRNKTENLEQNIRTSVATNNVYSIGARGGLLWIPFKHFGISTSILSFSSGFGNYKVKDNTGFDNVESTSTSINLSTSGSLLSQTFTVFYKF
jgi:hypothetical protein